MKKLFRAGVLLIVYVLLLITLAVPASADPNKALIISDGYDPIAAHENTIINLLGHFNIQSERKSVNDYVQGDIDNHKITFYVGTQFDYNLPPSFLQDVINTNKPITWINYNLWKISWNAAYDQPFRNKYGFYYQGPTNPNSRTYVAYNGQDFIRRNIPLAKVAISNPSIAQVAAEAYVPGGYYTYPRWPFIIQANNLTYVADHVLDVWYKDQPYIAFADHLHEQLKTVIAPHPTSHRALVRIEDINIMDNPNKLRAIADYMYSTNTPFSISVIPRYKDPNQFGANFYVDLKSYTQAQRDSDPTGLLTKANDVFNALEYMRSRNGTILMHGVTHQLDTSDTSAVYVDSYGYVHNKWDGISGADSEFYIHKPDDTMYAIPGETSTWVNGRLNIGKQIFGLNGWQRNLWVTPHYEASTIGQNAFARRFTAVYGGFIDSYYPFIINKTSYAPSSPVAIEDGQYALGKLIPENLDYVDKSLPASYKLTANDILVRANMNLVVRDGFASLFYHPEQIPGEPATPEAVDLTEFRGLVEGIKARGYTFVNVNSLL